jgi:hypothetical protein
MRRKSEQLWGDQWEEIWWRCKSMNFERDDSQGEADLQILIHI